MDKCFATLMIGANEWSPCFCLLSAILGYMRRCELNLSNELALVIVNIRADRSIQDFERQPIRNAPWTNDANWGTMGGRSLVSNAGFKRVFDRQYC